MICRHVGVVNLVGSTAHAETGKAHPSAVSRPSWTVGHDAAAKLLSRPCVRLPGPRKRRFVTTVHAAQTQSTSTRLPLNYYSILQVNSAASKDTLSRAFARLNKLDDSEFSAETLEARTHLLKVALDVLSDNTGRRIYDNAVQTGSYEIELEPDHLPAALSLLQEAGDVDTVLRWGTEQLQTGLGGSRALQKDLALAVANAYCDAAEKTFESDDLATHESMDAALQLLRQHRLAPKLQGDISKALEEVAARAALTLLALPLGPEYEDRRARGLDMLLATLSSQAAAWSEAERAAYLEAARPHMTAAEQVRLWEEQESSTLSEMHDAALAHLAEGVRACRVGLVRTADRLLVRLQTVAASAEPESLEAFDGEVDVRTERAVCRLLLGDMDGAESVLGLSAASSGSTGPDPGILAYVQEKSGAQSGDLLPGICALAHEVLVGVQLPQYRCCSGIRAPLTHWFDNRNVAMQLQLSDVWGLLRLSSVLRLLHTGAGALRNAVGAAVSRPLGAAKASAAAVSGTLSGGGQNGSHPAAGQLDPAAPSSTLQGPNLSSNDTIALIEGAYQQQPQLQSPSRDAERLPHAASASAPAAPSAAAPPAVQPSPVLSDPMAAPSSQAAEPWEPAASGAAASLQQPPAEPLLAASAPPEQQQQQRQQRASEQPPPQSSPAQQRFLAGARGAAVLERDVQPSPDEAEEAAEWGHPGEGDTEDEAVIGGSSRPIDGGELELMELEGEREMWAPVASRRQRRLRSLVGLGAVAALGLASVRILLPGRRSSPPPPPPSEPLTTVTSDVGHPIRGGPVRAVRRLVGHALFTKPAAHKLVTRWEAAKAAALGRRHQVGRLDGVLAPPMLGHWQGQARAAKAAGTFVECDLQEVTIEELEVSRPANEARIVAAIDESRAWVDAKTGQVLLRESGRSRVAYRALRTEGTWKLQASEALD